MNVLESETPLAIYTQDCKKRFFNAQIDQMKLTKSIYLEILAQLKSLLREISAISPKDQTIHQKQQQTNNHNRNQQICQTQNDKQCSLTDAQNKYNHHLYQVSKTKKQIEQLTQKLQYKIENYCCRQNSKNVLKCLELQKQEKDFYPILIGSMCMFMKNQEQKVTERQKQLQDIQDLKYKQNSSLTNLMQHNREHYCFPSNKSYYKQKDRKNILKTISSFDFNRRVLEVANKEITFLKLRKRRLEIELSKNKKFIDIQKIGQVQISQNSTQMKKSYDIMQESTDRRMSQEINYKKLQGLKNNIVLKQQLVLSKKNEVSAFENIVMVYQKDKFSNSLLEEKISRLQKKLASTKYQNSALKQKSNILQKEIQKLDWNKVCDQTFVGVENSKFDKIQHLSILDRTNLRPCDQQSNELSRLSINQSMIKRY